MNGERLLLDTNIVIGYLRGDEHIVRYLDSRLKEGCVLFVSQITRMEMLSYHGLSKMDEAEIKEFLTGVQVVTLDTPIEAKAVALRRAHRLKLPDAIIMASAKINNCVLVTCDLDLETKHIEGYRVDIPT